MNQPANPENPPFNETATELQEDTMDAEMMAEMMELLQESQQVFLGGREQDDEADDAASEDDAPEQALMQEAMDLMLESQQYFAGAIVAPASKPSEIAAPSVEGPCDLMAIFARGGELAIALSQYCVRSRNFDPLFVMLVKEFKLRPQHQSALAIYDSFCANNAPATLSLHDSLLANDIHLRQQIEQLRTQWQHSQLPPAPSAPASEEQDANAEAAATPASAATRLSTPQNWMFDFIVKALQNTPDSGFQRASLSYQPTRSVAQNLPGGDMTMAQRNFLTRVWLPVLRPRLVAAGFWRMSTVE